jgi:inhibitor of cysteine peptidase
MTLFRKRTMSTKPLRLLAVFFIALTVALTSCQAANEMRLDSKANGTAVTLKQGQSLFITLAANPSTGFTWEVSTIDNTFLQQAGDVEFTSSEFFPKPGTGGTQTFKFAPNQTGTTTLTLIYHRPWETNVAPIDTFTVDVTVQ